MKTIKNNSIYLTFLIYFLSIGINSQTIEEIVIKGNWRDTNLSKEDSSIAVLNSKTIESQALKHFENLSYLVPNLNFAASDSRARHFQIRGIGERSGYERTPNSAVGLLIDDIDFSGQGGIATTFDVDQIEVHRGPQGARIGSSAMAGLIYISTKEPTENFEGKSEIVMGTYGTINSGIAFGGPVNSNKDLTYRLAIKKDYSDGFRKNLFLNKSDTSKKDESTFRLKVNWISDNQTTYKFLVSQIELDDPADIWTIDGSLNTLSDKPGMDSQKSNAYGVKIYHQFEKFEFQSLSSATNTDVVLSYDADWGNPESHSPYIYDYFSETIRNRDTYSQEFRLVSQFVDKNTKKSIEWVIGASFVDINETNAKKDTGIYGDPSDPYGPYSSNSSSLSDFSSRNYSLFGNVDYLFNETTKISFGGRWENFESNYFDSYDESFSPSNKMTGGKLSLVKTLNNNSNIYFNIARGYNQGGFNLGLGLDKNSSNRNLYYDPEFLTNYEVGINSKFFQSKLNLGAVLFYSDRKNQQVLISTQVDPSDPNTFLYLTQNAAEGINNGLEVNIDFALSESLDVFANFGLLNTEIKNWISRPDIEGREQAHAPKNSFSIGINWKPTNQSYLSLNVVGKSKFYYSDSHNNASESYNLTNINYGYEYGQWTYSLWARNIFDKYYSVRGFYFGNEAPNFIDTLYRRHGDPRHIGVMVQYDF